MIIVSLNKKDYRIDPNKKVRDCIIYGIVPLSIHITRDQSHGNPEYAIIKFLCREKTGRMFTLSAIFNNIEGDDLPIIHDSGLYLDENIRNAHHAYLYSLIQSSTPNYVTSFSFVKEENGMCFEAIKTGKNNRKDEIANLHITYDHFAMIDHIISYYEIPSYYDDITETEFLFSHNTMVKESDSISNSIIVGSVKDSNTKFLEVLKIDRIEALDIVYDSDDALSRFDKFKRKLSKKSYQRDMMFHIKVVIHDTQGVVCTIIINIGIDDIKNGDSFADYTSIDADDKIHDHELYYKNKLQNNMSVYSNDSENYISGRWVYGINAQHKHAIFFIPHDVYQSFIKETFEV